MDAQLKKGLLEVCVLAAIREEESYGYKIISDLTPYIEISESTLYPILRRLESGGMLTARTEAYNGRLRKYFRITQLGTAKINEFVEAMEQFKVISDFITRGGGV
ncbi:MAG: PadR family transcriptional regulator [Clostridia bacterium]|nr:PadR family transcriptional regulator [Clostridia bacterium]